MEVPGLPAWPAFLEFSGGGVDGVRHLGAVRWLQENEGYDFRETVRGVSGCSSGAFLGMLLTLTKFNVEEAAKELRALPWQLYGSGATLSAAVNLYVNVAWKTYDEVAPRFLWPVLDRLCAAEKGRYITLEGFQRLTGVDLRMRALDLLSGETVTLHAGEHPTMPLARALWATMAFPYVHDPVSWKGMLLFDGGSVENFSLESFGREHVGGVLGFRIVRGHECSLGPRYTPLLRHAERLAGVWGCENSQASIAETFTHAASVWSVHLSVAAATITAMRTQAEDARCEKYHPSNMVRVEAESTPAEKFTDTEAVICPKRFNALLQEGEECARRWAGCKRVRDALVILVACIIVSVNEIPPLP